MTKHIYNHRPLIPNRNLESGQGGKRYFYHMSQIESNGHFHSVAQNGLRIRDGTGWDTYFWPHRYSAGPMLKLGFRNERRNFLVVMVQTMHEGDEMPKELDTHLKKLGFKRYD